MSSTKPADTSPLELIQQHVNLDTFGFHVSKPAFTDTIVDASANGSGFAMTSGFSSIKQDLGVTSLYYLAWVDNLFTTTSLTSTNVIQQWFAPRWNAANANGYSNFICEFKSNEVATSVRNTPSSLSASVKNSNGYQAVNNQGTSVDSLILQTGQANFAQSGGFTQTSCIGFRAAFEPNDAFTNLNVGDTISYVTGYRVLPNQQSGASAISQGESEVLTYVLLDLAVALTVSATAVSAVASLAF